jgi:hypothetical protein
MIRHPYVHQPSKNCIAVELVVYAKSWRTVINKISSLTCWLRHHWYGVNSSLNLASQYLRLAIGKRKIWYMLSIQNCIHFLYLANRRSPIESQIAIIPKGRTRSRGIQSFREIVGYFRNFAPTNCQPTVRRILIRNHCRPFLRLTD